MQKKIRLSGWRTSADGLTYQKGNQRKSFGLAFESPNTSLETDEMAAKNIPIETERSTNVKPPDDAQNMNFNPLSYTIYISKLYKCKICNFRNLLSNKLDKHQSLNHPDVSDDENAFELISMVELLQCKLCGHKVLDVDRLKNHMNWKHSTSDSHGSEEHMVGTDCGTMAQTKGGGAAKGKGKAKIKVKSKASVVTDSHVADGASRPSLKGNEDDLKSGISQSDGTSLEAAQNPLVKPDVDQNMNVNVKVESEAEQKVCTFFEKKLDFFIFQNSGFEK